MVARMLGTPITSEQPLMEAGLDSLGAIELRESLQRKFKTELPATLIFDYPSIAALSAFMSSQLTVVAMPRDHPSQVSLPKSISSHNYS